MKNKLAGICAAVLGLLTMVMVMAAPSFAHHGTAAYDTHKQSTVMGTVSGFDFANPHALIYLDVKQPDGSVRKWQGRLTSPNLLARAGWTRASLQLGQQITVSGFPAKNGANSIWIRKIVTSEGKELPRGIGDE